MPDLPKRDLHIHTHHLGCANETMKIPEIVRVCEDLGVEALAITDHVNRRDQLDLHRNIKREIEALQPRAEVYFGVELNYTGLDEGFVYSPAIRDDYGFQFAIGGIHGTYLEEYDIKKMVDIQHRHHLKTCRDPLVDVLVHPYWFGRAEFDRKGWQWFDTMKPVPASYARELGQAARDSNTAIEINGGANFDSPNYDAAFVAEYLEFLSIVAAEGPCFTVSSDAHDIGRLASVCKAWEAAAVLGISEDRQWLPDCAPLAGPRR